MGQEAEHMLAVHYLLTIAAVEDADCFRYDRRIVCWTPSVKESTHLVVPGIVASPGALGCS